MKLRKSLAVSAALVMGAAGLTACGSGSRGASRAFRTCGVVGWASCLTVG